MDDVQFDNVATELTRKESELFTVRAKLETAEKQAADCVQHVGVLKEQLRTRDSKVTTLSADVRSTFYCTLPWPWPTLTLTLTPTLCIHASRLPLRSKVEDLRKRLKEKEAALEKKSKQASQLVAERRQIEQEAGELREQSDLREKRVSLLQRKVSLYLNKHFYIL